MRKLFDKMKAAFRRSPGWFRHVVFPVVIYALTAAIFLWVCMDTWQTEPVSYEGVNAAGYVQLNKGSTLRQTFSSGGDMLETVAVYPLGVNAGGIHAEIADENGVIFARDIPKEEIPIGGELILEINQRCKSDVTISLTAEEDGMAFATGNTITAGKFEVEDKNGEPYLLDGESGEGKLVLRSLGQRHREIIAISTVFACCIGAIMLAVLIWTEIKRKKGGNNFLITLEDMASRYSFLLKQLVNRDFKVKYKGSMLGMLWSVLNPLLTTAVYYLVFSTLFKSNIPNFPVYLISGTIVFTYFTDATNQCLMSIVGNASLLTKVYIPKYILPLGKVISTAINFVISLLPLFVMMVCTGTPVTKSILLLPLFIGLLWCFVYGVGMMLAAANVYFRDMQFLWSVICMMWNFLTPIFYPISIIPAKLLPIYKLNPLTQLVAFIRAICMYGTAPTPNQFLGCALSAVVALVGGFLIFRKAQRNFMTHL